MLKKYILIGILVTLGTLASSAFSSVSFKPVPNYAVSIAVTDFGTVPTYYYYIPSIAETGFRLTPVSSNISSIAVTGFRTPAMSSYVASIAVTGFRTPAMSNYTASIAVADFGTVPMYYYYIPSIAETGFRLTPVSSYVASAARDSSATRLAKLDELVGIKDGVFAIDGRAARLVRLDELARIKDDVIP